jgi:hypothetical protein
VNCIVLMIYRLARFVRFRVSSSIPLLCPTTLKYPQGFPIQKRIPLRVRGMKRKASSSPEPTARKAAKVGDYCAEQPVCNANEDPIWPAPDTQLALARDFLKEW